jgi:tetratricopeptide (TPR) repeat protein
MKIYIFSAFLLLLVSILKAQETSIRVEYISFPTYPFSDPDPVARPGKIYPYFRFDGYSTQPVMQKHKMVVMENRWIKLWIAPDIGGKIWGALDKSTGKYFIYFNKVVKFREIAMRGPWTSGGIEFNFGSIGHAPSTANPVDYTIRNNKDGSVSCFLGATDLTSVTDWQVEVRLPSDKSLFETHSTWNNPTNLKTSLYHWQTAAADATDDLQYYFPGNAYIDHGGNVFDWPLMADGRDISLYRNNNYGTYHSYHVLGEYTDWFAGYYHKSNTGFGHWSRYPYKPGKKIWIWGLSRQGEIWKDLLTDPSGGNEQYTEIQTGLLFNQEADESTMSPFKHAFMIPGQVETFTESWFPISETKGVSCISKEGILNLIDEGNGFRLIFQSLVYLKDTLQVFDSSGKQITVIPVSLEPEQHLESKIGAMPADVRIKLKNGELYFEPERLKRSALDRPVRIDSSFDWGSVYGLYTRGIEKSRQRLYTEARTWLNKCITKDPSYIPAYNALADIDFREMKYDSAENKILKVISFDTYDPDANFMYGNLLTLKKEYNKARDAYGVTLRSPGYRSASLNELALIALKEGRFGEARDYLSEALKFSSADKNILMTSAVTARLSHDPEGHKVLLQKLADLDPLSHFVAFEKYLVSKDTVLLHTLRSGIQREFDRDIYTGQSLWYHNISLEEDALSIIRLAPADPMCDYLAAYLEYFVKDMESSAFYLNRALDADDRLVFPYRMEYTDILKWAYQQRHEWKTKYYMALLYWSRGQNEKALTLFNDCSDLPDSPSFYMSRARFYIQMGIGAEKDYLLAIRHSEKEWRAYHLLHEYYMSAKDYDGALSISQEAMNIFSGSYIIRTDHSKSLLNRGRYSECIDLLKHTEILPFEGAAYGRSIWRQANLLEAIRLINGRNIKKAEKNIAAARLWPENLGVGKPYITDELYEDLLDAICGYKSGKSSAIDKTGPLISRLTQQETASVSADYNDGKILTGIHSLLDSCDLK